MNKRTTFLTALLLTAATGIASAQPSQTTPAAPDPNPAPTGPLSHINGTPVKVGEHREYYYGYKPVNISANPLGWIIGIYGVSGSYALNNRVAIRGDVTVYSPVDDDDEGFELNVSAPIYFRHMYSGFFLEPGIMLREYKNSPEDDGETTFGPMVLAGWHHTWDSGLNVSYAFGLGRDLSSDDNKFDDDEPFVNGYFRVGYNF